MLLLACSLVVAGVLVCVSASNWLVAWVGLEANMIGFMPFVMKNRRLRRAQAAAKYYLAQVAGSLLFAGSYLMPLNSWVPGVMLVGLMIKLGAAPVHRWLPSVIADLNWVGSFLLLTLQKVAPLTLVYGMVSDSELLLLVGAVSAFAGAWGGLNQTHVRPLLAYSSISHIGWVLAVMGCSRSVALVYALVYLVVLVPLVLLLAQGQSSNPKLMGLVSQLPGPHKFLVALLFLSLAGMPPFSGFAGKALALLSLSQVSQVLSLWLVMCSGLSLAFYLHFTLLLFVCPQVSVSVQYSRAVPVVLWCSVPPALCGLPFLLF